MINTTLLDFHEKGIFPAEEKSACPLVLGAELSEFCSLWVHPIHMHRNWLCSMPKADTDERALWRKVHWSFQENHSTIRIIDTGGNEWGPTLHNSSRVVLYVPIGRAHDASSDPSSVRPCWRTVPNGRSQCTATIIPLSRKWNRYALVFQNYLTKWP